MSSFENFGRSAFEGAKAHARRVRKGFEIHPTRIGRTLGAAEIVAIVPICNEEQRLPFFLDYYRSIGVSHFIFVDNQSHDGTARLLEGQPDVSIFEARGKYSESRYAVDWVNYILSKYCVGKWILHIDADEILVFPHQETARLPQLCRHLEREGLHSLNAMLVDMYSDRPTSENYYKSGQDPLEVCKLFDAQGYEMRYDHATKTTWIKGGVRGRVYFSEKLWSGPALNKTPLILWKKHYAFLKSAHEVWPWKLNAGARAGRFPLTAALLHFKFMSSFTEKVAEEALRQQHTSEYAAYVDVADRPKTLIGQATAFYKSSRSLVESNLMVGEGWTAQTHRP